LKPQILKTLRGTREEARDKAQETEVLRGWEEKKEPQITDTDHCDKRVL
jgi:hypothetical protein